MAEVTAGGSQVKGQITVSFQSEPLVGFLVPVECANTNARDTRGIRAWRHMENYGSFVWK